MKGENKRVHGMQCSDNCEVCANHVDGLCTTRLTTFEGLIDMWTSTLCLVGNATFHDPKCLMGKCEQCGIDQLITCPQEEDKRS
jgi:hypothetical protein